MKKILALGLLMLTASCYYTPYNFDQVCYDDFVPTYDVYGNFLGNQATRICY